MVSYLSNIQHTRHYQLHTVREAHGAEQCWRVIDLAIRIMLAKSDKEQHPFDNEAFYA